MQNDSQYPTEFSVVYEGDALKHHTMDVKDLAPALLSLGQTFDRANSLLNGDNVSINLQIKAQKEGSFDIALLLSQTLQTASGTLNTDWVTSAQSLTTLLLGGSTGVVSLLLLIKQLKGEKPKQKESKESPDCITFEAENIKITVPQKVARLYNDKNIRDQIEGVVRPLTKSGINMVSFKQNKKEIGNVNNTEVEYFRLSDDKDNITEYIIPRQRLQIESLKFKQGKWQLNDGSHTNWYSMDDKEFINQIHNGKMFGENHILVCEVVMTQQLLPDGKLKLEYSVKKVLNHIIPGEQLHLN